MFFLVVKGPAADATDAPQPWGFLCNPVMKMTMMIILFFCPFPSNGAPMEWNWQGKTEELGEKPVPVPLCPPQIPHGLARDRTPGLRGGRPAANRLSYGIVLLRGEKRSTRRKNLIATLSITNPTTIGLELNPGFRGEKDVYS
jgi:hypothetical protein